MKYNHLIIILVVTALSVKAQNPNLDYRWWNETHGWEEGDPGWRNWIKITPGYLGPNALPVPHVQKGFIKSETEIEFTASNHFLKGDPTRDISGHIFLPFANSKIAVEVYGVLLEQFAFSEEIRNERFARIEDGKGIAMGDIYFSTLLQLIKNKKFPNTLVRVATKTASGNQLAGARYADSPGYFADISLSKEFGQQQAFLFRPFGLAGFYTWQTNDELNLQNDALLYALGTEFITKSWLFSASWAGYSGYKDERDKPMQINLDIRKDLAGKAFRIQYNHGVRDWEYKTVRVSFIWKLKSL
ncbi:MAG TPA: hypothetical protein VFD91_05435 [Mariniphaga sp.]|nr:hypothetical protein [Mariniphaga sp.]